ncbi:hypothetical protein VCHC50A2_1512B, partial [Vibrio cholerae HC-50A2]
KLNQVRFITSQKTRTNNHQVGDQYKQH